MNHLADSLSPYLLQHKDNPVDWHPWGEQAFAAARETDRPIFLSIGYAACHWCHVMEHESFENEAIAKFLNDHFVSIKVDREERPDIDQIYMNAVQVMTGRGGWPMSVFLDQDLEPFYAGTYWPPIQKFGMPGFPQVLDALVDAWSNRREEVQKHAGEITMALRKLAEGTVGISDSVPDDSLIRGATETLISIFDATDGGFGGAPKFPHATDLDLLLRRGLTRSQPKLIEAAQFTLDRMAAGGIRDHIGGGFARYSVDAKWLVPHFEKMLYDNSLLGEIYTRAFQTTGNGRHALVAKEIFDYLIRDMSDEAGGFHCSEDADSEGVEGKFYVWKPGEVERILGTERAKLFCKAYDITATGNFEGSSIPNLPRSIDAHEFVDDRETLRRAREQRIRPGRDDKVLTAWNSLAIKALAIGGSVLNDSRYIAAAQRAAEFILKRMTRADGRLLHAFRHGRSHLDAYLDDYAYTIEAFISLFEATGDQRWIQTSLNLADLLVRHFEDSENGGFFYTAADAEVLITRNKDWHDGSLISGNASAAMGLLRLSQLCDRADYHKSVERTLTAASGVLEQQSAACGGLLSVLDRFGSDGQQIVLAVPDQQTMEQLRPRYFMRYRPNTITSWVVGEPDSNVVSLNHDRKPVGGKPTIYCCQGFVCDQPLVGDDALQWLETGG